jgi:hypothetical protein
MVAFVLRGTKYLFGVALAVAIVAMQLTQTYAQQSIVALSNVLSADGKLNLPKNFQGSIDARGYQLSTDNNGTPIFNKAASDPKDAYWDPSFTVPGVTGLLFTVAVNGNYLYVGGQFSSTGNVIAHGVAKYDLTNNTWSALDSAGVGVSIGTATCFAFNGSDIYVGGQFTTAGSISATNIAKWNPATGWSTLGSGLNSYARSMVFSGVNLYVTGDFTQAGGNTVNYVAKWNGTTWSDLGGGVNGQAWGFAIVGGSIYVTGGFTKAGSGGKPVNGIAKWNGSSWDSLGSSGHVGVHGSVYNLVSYGDTVLYVGGYFDSTGGKQANNVARYSISTNSWSALGGGVNSTVLGMFIDGNTLYIGGDFTTAGIVSSNSIAKWNIGTSSWSNLGTGLNNSNYSIVVTGGKIYAAGFFTRAGDVGAFGIASWNGSAWSPLTSSASGSVGGAVYALAIRGDNVFVGGYFPIAGSSLAQNIAIWNKGTNQWSALDNTSTVKGVDGYVYSILPLSNGDVYIGGSFSHAGNTPVNNIVKWNQGTGWSALGTGTNGVDIDVRGMTMVGSDLYVTGAFANAGGSAAKYVAKWSGTTWSQLGTGLNGIGRAIVLAGSNIYVGGDFTTAGGNTVNHIASWNGTTWSGLGSSAGTDNSVRAIAVSGDTALYVGGYFLNAGGSAISHIAKYSIAGDKWSALSGGVNNNVYSVAVQNDSVLVGGAFTSAGLFTVNRIASWKISTSAWSGFGSGTDGTVNAIVPSANDNIIVGGNFSLAGNKPSYCFARYNPHTTSVHDQLSQQPKAFELSQNYPNPFNPSTTINYQLPAAGHVSLKVYDMLGREVAALVNTTVTAGEHAVTFDGSKFASGFYLYRLSSGNNVVTKKMLMIK